MSDELKYIDRIKEVHNIQDDKDVARCLGVKPDTFSQWKGRKKIPYKELIKYSSIQNVSLDWLILGNKQNDEKNNNYSIDVLDLKASAGSGVMPYEAQVIDKYILDKSFFKTAPQANKLKIIQVEGDSMEPTILDGAFIIIDETKTEFIDGIYACLIDDNIFIKRLQFDLDGSIKIISDNQKYEPKFYNPKNTQIFFKILGRKILTIQR